MKRFMTSALALGALLTSNAVMACGPKLQDKVIIRSIDFVADGDVKCDRIKDECILKVSEIIKAPGSQKLAPKRIIIAAGYRATEEQASDSIILCESSFPPKGEQISGRFFLRPLEDGRFHVYSYSAPDARGEFPDLY